MWRPPLLSQEYWCKITIAFPGVSIWRLALLAQSVDRAPLSLVVPLLNHWNVLNRTKFQAWLCVRKVLNSSDIRPKSHPQVELWPQSQKSKTYYIWAVVNARRKEAGVKIKRSRDAGVGANLPLLPLPLRLLSSLHLSHALGFKMIISHSQTITKQPTVAVLTVGESERTLANWKQVDWSFRARVTFKER